MQDLRVAMVQCDLVWEDKIANLSHISRRIDSLTDVDIIVLPEMFPTAFSMKPEVFAEKMDGHSFQWMLQKAALLNCAVAGSMMIEEEGEFFNRFLFVKPDGNFFSYDKRHPFRMGGESEHFSFGHKNVVFEYLGWKIKPLICYDLRFPVWAKNRYDKGQFEYDLLLTVANWPSVRNFVWKTLLSARAIENQSYVIGVNRIGEDGNGLLHSGDSNAINPKGISILTDTADNEFVEIVQLSAFELLDFRDKFQVGLDWDNFLIL